MYYGNFNSLTSIYVTKYIETPNFKFTIGNFWNSFTLLTVPIFVLLSGRFALSDERNIEVKYYYKKFFNRIMKAHLFGAYCILYIHIC